MFHFQPSKLPTIFSSKSRAVRSTPSIARFVTVPYPHHTILIYDLPSSQFRRNQGRVNDVLGFDASGVVVKASQSALFKEGDQVIFSGVIGRSGPNGQYAVVDSRIAGRKPTGWSDAEAASLPLVGITAWEMLHCHFNLVPFSRPKKEETLIIVNGAGGVGTVATQLARYVRIPSLRLATHLSLAVSSDLPFTLFIFPFPALPR